MSNNAIYALNTSTVRNCDLGLLEKIDLAAQTGYNGIELWVGEIESYLNNGGSLDQLQARLQQSGLVVPNLIAFFQWANPDDEKRQAALVEAVAVFELAQALDCPYVAAPPAGIADRTDIPLRDIATYYRNLLAATASLPAKPLLEFWGHATTLGSLKEAMTVMELVDDPAVLLLTDVFHMAKTPGSTDLLRQLDGARLGLFHLNDYPAAEDIRQLSDAERVYPGDGVAPLAELMSILREIGYSGMYSLELFNKGYEEAGAAQVMQTGLTKMKQLLG